MNDSIKNANSLNRRHHKHRSGKQRRSGRQHSSDKQRRGAAFILLVVAVLIVVLGAWHALLRSELSSRSNDRQHAQVETMVRAIDLASSLDERKEIALPIDQKTKQEIKVAPNDDETLWVANWIVDGEVVKTISRPLSPTQP